MLDGKSYTNSWKFTSDHIFSRRFCFAMFNQVAWWSMITFKVRDHGQYHFGSSGSDTIFCLDSNCVLSNVIPFALFSGTNLLYLCHLIYTDWVLTSYDFDWHSWLTGHVLCSLSWWPPSVRHFLLVLQHIILAFLTESAMVSYDARKMWNFFFYMQLKPKLIAKIYWMLYDTKIINTINQTNATIITVYHLTTFWQAMKIRHLS